MTKLTPVENRNDSDKAFAELRTVLTKGTRSFKRDIGWPSGHGEYRVYWHDNYGFWALPQYRTTNSSSRFWFAYGTQDPAKRKHLKMTCEINPPKSGRNGRCAGVFLRNSGGALYLAHNGRVGGGKKGVGKQKFRHFYGVPTQTVKWLDGKSADLFVIGKVPDQKFLSNLARFIRKVDEFKMDARSVDKALDEDAQRADRNGDYDPKNVKEGQQKILHEINLRLGQPKFRKVLLKAYAGRCAISNCDCTYALEAAHIQPYGGADTNHVQNGILLRSDLHVLFDLRKIGIHPINRTVVVAKSLLKTVYGKLNGKPVRSPAHPSQLPNEEVLKEHWDRMEDRLALTT
ncbi:MAG TPA: HNH endonuclease signature motif containing protein [Terriglobales bacterium]|nr:HNH endonuclease signature motif containing protein [Terriglobales bacterium]